MDRVKRSSSREQKAGFRAAWKRSSRGNDSTHWRTGTLGKTSCTRCSATSSMRRSLQLGQLRALHENATSRSNPQS